jgi:hypothetical protein
VIAHTAIVSIRSISEYLRSASADDLADCSDRQVYGCLNSWVSEFPVIPRTVVVAAAGGSVIGLGVGLFLSFSVTTTNAALGGVS